MSSTQFIRFCFLSTAFSGALLQAQQAPAPGRVVNLPYGRGVYYDDPAGAVSLPSTTVLAFTDGWVRDYFNVGRMTTSIEVPGARAGVTIANPKPTFYVTGYPSGTRLYLVRGIERQDYRQIKMNFSRDFTEWNHLRPKALADIDVQAVAPGIITVTPKADLPPGEYLILTTPDREFRAIQLCFEFSVMR
jgi:hypothetical protein